MNFLNPKTQLEKLHGDIKDKKAKGKSKPVWKIAVVRKPLERIWQTIKRTLAGENKAGKILATAKDILLQFVPYGAGSKIDIITDAIGDSLKNKDMAKETLFKKIIRFLKQPTTRDGIAVLVAIIGAVFALDIDPAVLTTSILGIVTGIAGVWASVKSLIGIFKDEDA